MSKRKPHTGRSAADERLAAELAAGATVVDAAGAAGIALRTAHRRLDDPDFAARVRELRAVMVSASLGRLSNEMAAAADALNELVGATSPAVRLRAARAVLEIAMRLREATEIEERLAAVEPALSGDRDGEQHRRSAEARGAAGGTEANRAETDGAGE